MANNKLKKIVGQVIAGLAVGAIAYFIIIQFKPKSESEVILSDSFNYFQQVKDDPFYKDNAINSAIIVYSVDPNSKEAKVVKDWAIQQGSSIEEFIKADSINRSREKTYNSQQLDSIVKSTNDYLLYKGMPENADDAFEKVHIAFEGMPDKDKVKALLETVMNRYNIVINNDNVLKVSNVLVVFKNESKVGVTEMDILKHIYQNGTTDVDYPTQAAISASILEEIK